MLGNERKVSVSKPNEVITAENCIKLGERMAINALKFRFKYGCEYSFKLYNGLAHDINYRNEPNYVVSDGYDFAQDAALFLFEHVGKRLNDKLFTDKNGEAISIKLACIKMLTSKIHQNVYHARKTTCLDETRKLETASVKSTEEEENIVEEKIEQMKLTDKQKEVVLMRIAGFTFGQIAKALNKGRSCLFRHLEYARKKYLAHFNEPILRSMR